MFSEEALAEAAAAHAPADFLSGPEPKAALAVTFNRAALATFVEPDDLFMEQIRGYFEE